MLTENKEYIKIVSSQDIGQSVKSPKFNKSEKISERYKTQYTKLKLQNLEENSNFSLSSSYSSRGSEKIFMFSNTRFLYIRSPPSTKRAKLTFSHYKIPAKESDFEFPNFELDDETGENFDNFSKKNFKIFENFSKEYLSKSIGESNNVDIISEFINKVGYNKFHFYLFLISAKLIFLIGCETMITNLTISTMKDDWNLTDYQVIILSSAVFLGIFFSTFILNFIVSKKGRRKPIIISSMIILIFSNLIFFFQYFYICLLAKFCIGCAIGLIFPCLISLIIEFIPDYYRSLYLNAILIFYPLGLINVCCLSIVFTKRNIFDWKYVNLIDSFIAGIAFYLSFFIKESPRFLLIKAAAIKNSKEMKIENDSLSFEKNQDEKRVLIDEAFRILDIIGKFTDNKINNEQKQRILTEIFYCEEKEYLIDNIEKDLSAYDTLYKCYENFDDNLPIKSDSASNTMIPHYLNERCVTNIDKISPMKIKEKIKHANYQDSSFCKLRKISRKNFQDFERRNKYIRKKSKLRSKSLTEPINISKLENRYIYYGLIFSKNNRIKHESIQNSRKKLKKKDKAYSRKDIPKIDLSFNKKTVINSSRAQIRTSINYEKKISELMTINKNDNISFFTIMFLWFISNFISIGILYLLPKHFEIIVNKDKAESFKNIILSIYFLIPSPLIRGYLSESKYFGRKFTLILGFFFASIICFVCYFVKKNTFAYLGFCNFFINISFGILQIYTAEYFDTKMRTSALAIGNTVGKFGAICAPFLCEIFESLLFNGSLIFFSVLCIVSFIFILFLEETRQLKIK